MSKTINFVQDRRKSLSLNEEKDQILLRKMVRIFIGVFLLFLLAIGFRLFFAQQLNQMAQKQQDARAGILQQESVEREYSIFSNKLKHIASLWGKRQNKQSAIAFFMKLFSAETSVSGLSYSAETEALTFRLKANSIFVLESAMLTLASTTVTDTYPGISKNNLSRADDASYTLTVTVVLAGAQGQK